MNQALKQRLDRLLEDERTQKIAAQAGRMWLEDADDSRLAQNLDFIEDLFAQDLKIEQTNKLLESEARQKIAALFKQGLPSGFTEILMPPLDAGDFQEVIRQADELERWLTKQREDAVSYPMNWRGEWSQLLEYSPGDIVRYEGLAYICLAGTRETRPRVEMVAPWLTVIDPKALARLVPVTSGGGGGTGPAGPQGPVGPQGPPGVGSGYTPTSAKRSKLSSSALASGVSVDLDAADITAGTTGYLIQVSFASSVSIRADLKTVSAGVPTTVDTFYSYMGDVWETPALAFVSQAGGAGKFFRVTITNLDPFLSADVHSTVYWDEV